MRHINWHIGCSGFYYKEWTEVFYPKGLAQSRWFDYYAQHFNTLEINNTFYRFPELKLFQNWYNKSPSTFCFSVKVPRIITHQKKFNDTKNIVDDFYAIAKEGLKEKLGAILFQLPPSFAHNETALQNILSQLNPFFQTRLSFATSVGGAKMFLKPCKKRLYVFAASVIRA